MTSFGVVLFTKLYPRSGPQEPGSDECFVGYVVDFIAGNLFTEKLVIRLVFIEGVNDVVTIAPGVRTPVVLLESCGVGIARDVHPMSPQRSP